MTDAEWQCRLNLAEARAESAEKHYGQVIDLANRFSREMDVARARAEKAEAELGRCEGRWRELLRKSVEREEAAEARNRELEAGGLPDDWREHVRTLRLLNAEYRKRILALEAELRQFPWRATGDKLRAAQGRTREIEDLLRDYKPGYDVFPDGRFGAQGKRRGAPDA